MKIKTLALAVGLAVAALGSIGASGVAQAAPILQIVSDAAGNAPLVANKEAIGDPGGANYANPATTGASAGVGIPTVLGGWPNTASFDADPSFGGARGISGYDGSYLNLTQAANVTFQFTGTGNSTDHNLFQIDLGAGWATIWDNQSSSNGTCGVSGTSLSCPFALSQQTFFFTAGLIDFRFVNLTTPLISTNDGIGNLKDLGGFHLGVDPYLTTVQYDTSGTAVYAGFTDRPPPGDHDYQDLSVRISVPEPGTLLLLGGGLMGLAGLRRRKA